MVITHLLTARWWHFKDLFIFTPDPWGFMIQFDGPHIFQRGWFNHQLAMFFLLFLESCDCPLISEGWVFEPSKTMAFSTHSSKQGLVFLGFQVNTQIPITAGFFVKHLRPLFFFLLFGGNSLTFATIWTLKTTPWSSSSLYIWNLSLPVANISGNDRPLVPNI